MSSLSLAQRTVKVSSLAAGKEEGSDGFFGNWQTIGKIWVGPWQLKQRMVREDG